MKQKLARLALVVGLGAGLGLTACTAHYEDCEVDDQYVDGDMTVMAQTYESDCGYWEQNGEYFLRESLVAGGTWHWWTWVTPGQLSYAPNGWKPPHGLEPPREDSAAKKRRKQREKTAEQKKQSTTNKTTTTTKNGNTPKTGSGNQGIPKNDTVTKPKPVTRPRG